jgi:hypothetical protein
MWMKRNPFIGKKAFTHAFSFQAIHVRSLMKLCLIHPAMFRYAFCL